MFRFALLSALLLLSFLVCNGQTSSSPQLQTAPYSDDTPSDPNAIHGNIPILLSKSIDSRKVKVGDTVYGETAAALHLGNGMLIPSGTKVIGHVTMATARSKGDSESALGINFDTIKLANGKEITMKAVIRAAAPYPQDTGPNTGAASPGTIPTGRSGGGDDLSTMAPPTGGVSGTNSFAKVVQSEAKPLMSGTSTEATGYPDVELGKNSVLFSSGKEVKLGNKAQILLKAELQIR